MFLKLKKEKSSQMFRMVDNSKSNDVLIQSYLSLEADGHSMEPHSFVLKSFVD